MYKYKDKLLNFVCFLWCAIKILILTAMPKLESERLIQASAAPTKHLLHMHFHPSFWNRISLKFNPVLTLEALTQKRHRVICPVDGANSILMNVKNPDLFFMKRQRHSSLTMYVSTTFSGYVSTLKDKSIGVTII